LAKRADIITRQTFLEKSHYLALGWFLNETQIFADYLFRFVVQQVLYFSNARYEFVIASRPWVAACAAYL
jgi:hypothetical protein